ncbi:MAG: hypothetical protein ACKVSF_07185, partial [Alphaproteobacteria bacterium]
MSRDSIPEGTEHGHSGRKWLRVGARAAAGAVVIAAFVFALLTHRSEDAVNVDKLKESYNIGEPDRVLAFGGPAAPDGLQFMRDSTAWNVNVNGQLEEVPAAQPRLALYGPLAGGWLIEEARTNIALHARELGKAPWRLVNGTSRIDDGMAAPDPLRKAVLVRGQGDKCATLSLSAKTDEANAPYTASVFLKADGAATATLGVEAPKPSAPSTITVAIEKEDIRVTAKPVLGGYEKLGGGWIRVWTTVRNTAPGPIEISITGACEKAALWVWGAQLEKGIGATSFIPAETSPAIRAADRLVAKDVQWIEQATGT